jgi:hypothetical protein
MRRIAGIVLLSLSAAVAAARPSAPPGCRTASPEVERLIAGRARALAMTEHCQFRRYDALDDVDGDGKDDFLVLFTVEGPRGGNDHVSFLAAFLSTRPERPILVEAGRRGERDPVSIEARRGEVALETREYLPRDPMCCPSGKGRVVFRLSRGQLLPVGKGGR